MILDTNALSAAAEEHSGIAKELAAAAQVALSVKSIGEFRYGISQSRYRARYVRWLDGLMADCRVREVTQETTHSYAEISLELRKSRKVMPTNDLRIAALCRQHDLPLLSRDRHFDAASGIHRLEW